MMEDKDKNNLLVWDIFKSDPALTEKIREKLREVKDPEIGLDIIQLGLIRNVQPTEEGIKITMILTTPYCPYGPMLMEAARKRVEELIDKKTEIVYGKEPWDRTMMEEGSGFDWGLF